ncbi:MAG: acylneuraminate cytidylyltransferase [Deltaproteobacteria bacterium]|nr:MAG: acylneuraminate cytidylyltransferase [Deltaproteobacteria bacterium]
MFTGERGGSPAEGVVRTVAIVQARMGSSRLPGKVMLELGGHPVLEQVVSRLATCRRLDEVVVAVPAGSAQRPIHRLCRRLDMAVATGPENDVLERYRNAARNHDAEVVVRITADCPCLDARVVDLAVETFIASGADYASNTLQRTWPRGYDVEVFSRAALERAAASARLEHEREHVTPALWQHPERFRIQPVLAHPPCGNPDWRLCLDTPRDYAMLRLLWRGCADSHGHLPGARQVAAFLEANPWLTAINAKVRQQPVPPPAAAREAVG